ncbi:MAG: hypothetical protein EHM65_03010, partial [Acidobacteriales bacterium]
MMRRTVLRPNRMRRESSRRPMPSWCSAKIALRLSTSIMELPHALKECRGAIQQAAENFFAADFLQAFDAVLYFSPLTPVTVRAIAEIEIEAIRERLAQRGISLIVDQPVLDLVAQRGFHRQT